MGMKDPRSASLLSVAEAAEKLGVSRWRVNQLIAEGRLQASKVGRAYVVREEDLGKLTIRKPGRPRSKPKPPE
jgi:excisionase family DNA binding protein